MHRTELPEHFEKYLGRLQNGWKFLVQKSVRFQICQFSKGEAGGRDFYATVGVSNYLLPAHPDEREACFELLLADPRQTDERRAFTPIVEAVRVMFYRRQPLRRGEVLGPYAPFFEGSEMTALYIAPARCFPVDFGEVDLDGYRTIVWWMIPITTEEAKFVRERGWRAFDVMLLRNKVDLFDIHREGLI